MTETKYFDEITDPQLTDWLLMQQASEGGITGKVAIGNLPGTSIDFDNLPEMLGATNEDQLLIKQYGEADGLKKISIDSLPFASQYHGHQISEVTGLQASLNSKTDNTAFTNTASGLQQTDANLQLQINNKPNSNDVAPKVHQHAMTDVTNLQSTLSTLSNTDASLQNQIDNKLSFKITKSLASPSNPAVGDVWEQTDANGYLVMRWTYDGKWKSSFLKRDVDLVAASSQSFYLRPDYQYGIYVSQLNYFLQYVSPNTNLTETSGFDVTIILGLNLPNVVYQYRNRSAGFLDTKVIEIRKEINIVPNIIESDGFRMILTRVGSPGYPNIGFGMVYQLIYK